MATIDINFTELKQNYMTANETNTTLNTIFLNTNSELEAICKVVNCTDLTSSTAKITESIANITKSNVECLTNINEFLKAQVNYYETASVRAQNSLQGLNSRINASLTGLSIKDSYSGNIRG